MDAASILGALLGGASKSSQSSGSGGGLLGNILGSVLGGKASKAQPKPSSVPKTGAGQREDELQKMMRDAQNRFDGRREGRLETSRRAPEPTRYSELDNESAVVLIRAMINAAKADGQLDQLEQNAIVEQLGDVTQDEIDFLKAEFASPLDVREFAWSVPLGMEEQAYGLSIMAIKLDLQKEASYLKDLAHGLRMGPEACNRIHDQYGAPRIYQ